MNLEKLEQAKLAHSAMALPTQRHMSGQQLISATYIKITIKNNKLENRYYFTVYLERQTMPTAAQNTKIEEN